MTQRMERLQKLARQVLSDEIRDLKDPRIGFATVTAVRITPDLRYARVFVSVLGDHDEQSRTMEGLRSAAAHLRSELGSEIRVKYTPELSFELDETEERAERVERLIHKLHESEGEA